MHAGKVSGQSANGAQHLKGCRNFSQKCCALVRSANRARPLVSFNQSQEDTCLKPVETTSDQSSDHNKNIDQGFKRSIVQGGLKIWQISIAPVCCRPSNHPPSGTSRGSGDTTLPGGAAPSSRRPRARSGGTASSSESWPGSGLGSSFACVSVGRSGCGSASRGSWRRLPLPPGRFRPPSAPTESPRPALIKKVRFQLQL